MRSFSVYFLVFSLAPSVAGASSEELVRRVGGFYQGSECARKTSEFTGESPAAVSNSLREILRSNTKQSNEEAIYGLLETVSGSKFSLEMNCLPSLKSIAPYDRWLRLLREKNITSLGSEDSAANRLVAALSDSLSQEQNPAMDPLKTELIRILEPLYAEFQVRQSLMQFFRFLSDPEGEGRALLFASRLGDNRALSAAEKAIDAFLTGHYDDKDGYHRAVLALEAYNGFDPAIISNRKALLKKISASPVTPEITRRVAEKAASAR